MSKNSYTPLRINTLRGDIEIPFSLFIFYKNKYLEYNTPGTIIEKSKFKKLRRQKVAKFYIHDTDETRYQEFVDQLLNEVLNQKDALTEDKVNIVEGQASNAIDAMSKNPETQDSYNSTRKAAKNIQKLILEDPKALQTMYGGDRDEDDPIIKHSLNVAALSIKVAKEMKLDEAKIDFLSTAALMHDIGLVKNSQQDFFSKNITELNRQETKVYYLHCTDIVEVLQDKSYVNKEILELIYNHEEDLTGSGPLKNTKLTLSQSILSLVNTYDKKISVGNKSPKEALKAMMVDELGKYDLKHLQVLQKVVKSQITL